MIQPLVLVAPELDVVDVVPALRVKIASGSIGRQRVALSSGSRLMSRSCAPEGIVKPDELVIELTVSRSSMHPFHTAFVTAPPVTIEASCCGLNGPDPAALGIVPVAFVAIGITPPGSLNADVSSASSR